MDRLAAALAEGGYHVVNQSYPSRTRPVAELVQVVDDGVVQCRQQSATTIHFVTHSLGGILVRAYFQDRVLPEAGRVVMLAPPNHGSEIADAYAGKWWYRLFTGPAGQELGTGPGGVARGLDEIPLEIGIIAGTRSIDPWFARVLPGPDDGKVSVASTRLAEMRDFMTVPYSHTFIARRAAVARQVLAFLADGRFDHADQRAPT
jgi:hypothetical protein